jgi:hypothetical protein
MAIKLKGRRKAYNPKDADEVRCDAHGVVTTWGDLGPLQRMALEAGIDVGPDLPCLLSPDRS